MSIQRELLSATLKAEAIRIRYLRNKAGKALDYARRTGDEGARERFFELKEAAVCPSERARCANLALGFLKGRPYLGIEAKTRTSKIDLMGRIAAEVAKKAGVDHSSILAWFTEGLFDASRGRQDAA